ncbi:hypothetical protein DW690_05020 [Dorea longicatena]|nr:hypothetical protein DW690_05020 [Dorea longicatena]
MYLISGRKHSDTSVFPAESILIHPYFRQKAFCCIRISSSKHKLARSWFYAKKFQPYGNHHYRYSWN